MPPRFFKHPTSIMLSINTLLFSILFYWCLFFLPVFFQAVKIYSPRRSGVAMLPFSLFGIPGSILGAIALTRWGRYKLMHIIAFGLQTLGVGLFTLQWEETTVAEWVFQIILAIGVGIIFTTLLPPFQVFLDQQDIAPALLPGTSFACLATSGEWLFQGLFLIIASTHC